MQATDVTYESIDDIIADTKRHGNSFFNPDEMRHFRSRVYDDLYGPHGEYFITSERFVMHYPFYHLEPRKYTVRKIGQYADGSFAIIDVSTFQQYSTLAQARTAA